jgi:hypothetical protein
MVTLICVVTCYKHICEGSSSETHLGIVLGNGTEGTVDAKNIACFANFLNWTFILLKCFFTEFKIISDMLQPCGIHSVNRFHLNNPYSSSMSDFNFYMVYSFGTLKCFTNDECPWCLFSCVLITHDSLLLSLNRLWNSNQSPIHVTDWDIFGSVRHNWADRFWLYIDLEFLCLWGAWNLHTVFKTNVYIVESTCQRVVLAVTAMVRWRLIVFQILYFLCLVRGNNLLWNFWLGDRYHCIPTK